MKTSIYRTCSAVWLLLITAQGYAFDHAPFERVLQQYVDEAGYVDYQGIYDDREDLESYVIELGRRGPESTPAEFGSSSQKLAYYLNAYNALVIDGVLDRGPEQKSVWRGLISGYNFFVRLKITVDGQQTNLKSLEDDLIRAGFRDPRIHAAINCASISCPRLRREVFTAEKLDVQLDAAMREFVNDQRHVQVQGDVVWLSAIFDWFEEDFLEYPLDAPANFTIVDYVNRYRHEPLPATSKVRYLDYDKGINHQ